MLYQYVLSTRLTPWSKILLQKLRVTQLVNKFPVFLHPKFHYHVHRSPSHVLILSQTNPLYILPHNFLQIHFNSVLWSIPWISKWPIPSDFYNITERKKQIFNICIWVHIICLQLNKFIIFTTSTQLLFLWQEQLFITLMSCRVTDFQNEFSSVGLIFITNIWSNCLTDKSRSSVS
jgi:hypothetical protein